MIINVTASVSYSYDTDDGLVSNEEEAIEDVRSVIDNRQVQSSDFDIEVQR